MSFAGSIGRRPRARDHNLLILKGKTTLPPPVKPASETIVADSVELCATPLNINSRGNGIHLWNSEENVLKGNTITKTRDGIYFSFRQHASRRTFGSERLQPLVRRRSRQPVGRRRSSRSQSRRHWRSTHREPDLLGNLRRPFPLAGLLSGSPALGLLRFAHERVAIPGIQAIEDSSPLTPAFSNDRR